MTKPDAIDEHGNALLDIDPLSSAGQLVALLEYGRCRGFRIGPYVKIGELAVQVQDLRQTEGADMPSVPDEGIWKAAGYEEGDR